MKITLPINPADIPTAQEKGVRVVNGIPMFYKKPPLLKFEKWMKDHLSNLLKLPNVRIPDGQAVYLHITYLFPYPKSTPKSQLVDMIPMVQQPDGDNLSKAIIDCLGDEYKRVGGKKVLVRKGFFANDSAITPLIISKFRTTGEPKVIIVLKPRSEGVI